MARRTIPAVLLLALTVGCGSTVQVQGSATVADGTTGGLSGGTTGTGGAPVTTTTGGTAVPGSTGAAVTAPGTNSGGAAGGGTSGVAASSTGTAVSVPGPHVAPGEPVEVGIAIVKGYEQFYQAIGVKGGFGPQEQQAQAVIDEINREGGLAGHPIKPVFAYSSVQDTTPAPQQEQRICDTFTQDHHVVAAIANQRPNTLAACLDQRHVPFFVTSGEDYTIDQLRAWPFFVAPSTLSEDDAVRVLVQRAAAQGYFKATAQDLGPLVKVGYLYYDTPYQTRVAKQVLEPLLKAQGVADIVPVAITYPNSGDDGSKAIAQIQSSVLTFRGRGVTHVLILDNGGNLTFNFPTYAESQQYRPRYAMSTFNAIGIEQDYANSSGNQLKRMVGVGWNPQFDVREAQSPGETPAGKRCLALMTKNGIGSAYGIQRSVQFDDCDDLFAMQLAFNAAGSLQPQAVIRAVATLRAVPSAVTFQSSFVGRSPFSVAATRDLTYDASCTCVAYTGPVHPFS